MFLLVGSAAGTSALAALSGEVTGLLAVVADLWGATVTVSSGRAAASVETAIASAIGPSVLGGVVSIALFAELNGDALASELPLVKLLDRLICLLLILVINEGVVALFSRCKLLTFYSYYLEAESAVSDFDELVLEVALINASCKASYEKTHISRLCICDDFLLY